MHPTQRDARLAGALYLVSSIPAVFSLQYVPSVLFVSSNASATVHNILASETLFRLGMACELIMSVAFIFVVRSLSRLFEGVDKTYASLMVTLLLVSVPISFVNVLNEVAVLLLSHGTGALPVFERRQMDAMAMLFLNMHSYGIDIAAIFWGLWLLPFGILVIKCGFLPRILGVLLIAACFGYLADSFTSLLLPAYGQVVNRVASLAEGVGELSIIAWLLIRGVKVRSLAAKVS